ncbi:MAG TPA: SH3 domain-containing protein [Beutenbergiaceae bacterium]|nr:SH3 domain-containing protein [Beutenbergiaceae bacterium]
MFRSRIRTTGVLATGALLLALGACAEEESPPADPGTETETGDETDDPDDTDDGDTDAGDTDNGTDPADLPGEAVEMFPFEGDSVDVVGVTVDDVLYVRSAPDPEAETVAELDPVAEGVIATGHNRSLDDGGIWAEVEVDGLTGWANTSYLAYLGETTDAGADFSDLEPADDPEALAQEVGEHAVQLSGAEGYVIAAGSDQGGTPEYVIDLLGLPDDSVGGERLTLLTGTEPSGDYAVESVQRTVICDRGVDEEGLCL